MIVPQVIAALAAVLALIGAAGWVARRSPALAARRAGSEALRLRGSLALDSRRRIHLIETQAGAALVLTGGGRDQMLAWPQAPGGGI